MLSDSDGEDEKKCHVLLMCIFHEGMLILPLHATIEAKREGPILG